MKLSGFILFISIAFGAKSQNKIDEILDFKISCGSGAHTLNEIQSFKVIADQYDSSYINKKLFQGTKIEQVLAVIILKHYQTNEGLQLTKDQQKAINKISKSKTKFTLCNTCLFWQSGTIKKLFNYKYKDSYMILESYLLKSF